MILLVHRGLHGEIDSQRFWADPGILEDLKAAGHSVLAPDQLLNARSWAEEGDRLRPFIIGDSATVIAGSNGCSAALRLTLDHPDVVGKLALCWPASPSASETSDTIRGVADSELETITIPVAIVPSEPPNIHHQAQTVTALKRLIPQALVLPGTPMAPQPEFADHRPAFMQTLLLVL